MSRRSHRTVRGRIRSQGTQIRRSSRKQSAVSPKRSHEIPGTTRAGTREIIATTGIVAKTGLAAKTDIITKKATRMAEERRGLEEKKFHSVTSMAETKAIGQMNAPSPSKRKQSSSAKVPCQQRQSTTPRNDHNKLPFHLPHGP